MRDTCGEGGKSARGRLRVTPWALRELGCCPAMCECAATPVHTRTPRSGQHRQTWRPSSWIQSCRRTGCTGRGLARPGALCCGSSRHRRPWEARQDDRAPDMDEASQSKMNCEDMRCQAVPVGLAFGEGRPFSVVPSSEGSFSQVALCLHHDQVYRAVRHRQTCSMVTCLSARGAQAGRTTLPRWSMG